MTEEKKYVTFKDLKTKPAPRSPSTASISRSTSTPSIAPERDFQRVPNSVTKHAMAQGLFRGKSKQVYDYLWSVSRGAIVPTRRVRKSRKEIKAGSGLGSLVTVDASLEHLLKVGLLTVESAVGSVIGNTYEVFTYEEASTRSPSTSSTSSLTQNLVKLDQPESGYTRTTQVVDSTGQSSPPKTSFKTSEQTIDDDAARAFEALKQIERELTGKASKPEQWGEVFEVLIAELKIAAARTTVSSVPAFLAEHLRRRLWKMDKCQAGEKGIELPDNSPAIAQNSPSDCPACKGSGWEYPNGPDGGVRRCKHDKLPVASDK